MTTSNAKIYPLEIKLHQSSKLLEIKFNNLTECMLSCEFLRVYSPSAEVRGHGPGQETLQIHKENVGIENIESIGQYAIKFTFSDGHNTGIYSWDYLYELAATYDVLWEEYLRKLSIAGIQRTKKDVE
ncbi:gamma-butyrobetaine hydroxylase-like domain-containing protein [Candidatus Methylopumilus universalis]|uniref:gamma-butyrobetaine hydroxylase-like domain-containing protein n=1 Tax=Candidatus Methylopumilus universalis TaxID=2588536 RepID=UPI003BEED26C